MTEPKPPVKFLVGMYKDNDYDSAKTALEKLASDMKITFKRGRLVPFMKGECSQETYERVFRTTINYATFPADQHNPETQAWQPTAETLVPSGLEDKIDYVEIDVIARLA